uniref:NAD-dependent epimerase/dehydratase domain-containing protein n=1 Tax=Rhizochromulina marina TaxID=1034831 RepID=A0A7S2SS59_9STRA|mmetsp:Transcript_5993/g.17517  ORF Transcript_5993/g.17517 Transcript_5993/m.17517 type:complete len:363 (+) Transcript_5993:95-1183(+)
MVLSRSHWCWRLLFFLRVSPCLPLQVAPGSAATSAGPHVVVFGAGYVATYLTPCLRAELPGCRVTIASRNASRLQELCEAGACDDWLHFVPRGPGLSGGLDEAGRQCLRSASHVICTAPPDPGVRVADPFVRCHQGDLFQVPWLGYLSTTGVYGDWGGAWVGEDAEPRTTLPRGLLRLEAEREWMALPRKARAQDLVPPTVDIFRCAGIYGPGRSALDVVARAAPHDRAVESVEGSGDATVNSAVDGTTNRFVSRIHVEDLCGAVTAAMKRPHEPGATEIWNIADDQPAPRQDVLDFAADLLGFGPVSDPGRSSERQRRAEAEHKRVSNTKLKTDLGYALRYSSFQEGLRGIAPRASFPKGE